MRRILHVFPPATRSRCPRPTALAALGTVLCVYRSRCGDGLGGESHRRLWQQAVRAEAWCGIDSDGWQECLQFRDRDAGTAAGACTCCRTAISSPGPTPAAGINCRAWSAPHAACRDCGSHRRRDDGHRRPAVATRVAAPRRRTLAVERICACMRWRQAQGAAERHLGRQPRIAGLSPLGSLADMLQRVARLEDIDLGARFDGNVATPWRVASCALNPFEAPARSFGIAFHAGGAEASPSHSLRLPSRAPHVSALSPALSAALERA